MLRGVRRRLNPIVRWKIVLILALGTCLPAALGGGLSGNAMSEAPIDDRALIERAVREAVAAGSPGEHGIARVDCSRKEQDRWECLVTDGKGGRWQCTAERDAGSVHVSYFGPINSKPAKIRKASR
jgi:hypothetical protein